MRITTLEQFNELKEDEYNKVTHLYLYNKKLTTIDLSKLVNLEYLDVSNNRLKLIDISKNKKLISVNVCNNHLKSLDVIDNKNLRAIFFTNK